MPKLITRGRRWLTGAVAAALLVSVAALLLSSKLEHAVRGRIQSAALRHGMVARISQVHFGVWPLLRLDGVDLDLSHGLRMHADTIAATSTTLVGVPAAATVGHELELVLAREAGAPKPSGQRGRRYCSPTIPLPNSVLEMRSSR